MKKFSYLATAFTLTLLLAACGTNNSDTDSSSASTADSSVAATEQTISYLGEDYTLSYPTSKVVTASLEAMEDAAALKFQPLGAITVSGEIPSYLKSTLGDNVANVGDKFGPDVEAVTTLAPDVILGSTKFDEQVTANLNEIAPTINVSHQSADWDKNLLLLGELIGETDTAQPLIDTYNDDLAAFKKEHTDLADTSVVMLRIREGELCVYGPGLYYNPMLYDDLGFKMPDEIADIEKQTTISVEQFVKWDVDLVLVQFMDSENSGQETFLDELKENTVWKSSEAHANDSILYNIVDGGYQGGTYLSKDVMLQALKTELSN